MSSIYFKFKSNKDFDSISIDGHFIKVAALKDKIVDYKGLGADDVQIFDAQTEEGAFHGSSQLRQLWISSR